MIEDELYPRLILFISRKWRKRSLNGWNVSCWWYQLKLNIFEDLNERILYCIMMFNYFNEICLHFVNIYVCVFFSVFVILTFSFDSTMHEFGVETTKNLISFNEWEMKSSFAMTFSFFSHFSVTMNEYFIIIIFSRLFAILMHLSSCYLTHLMFSSHRRS